MTPRTPTSDGSAARISLAAEPAPATLHMSHVRFDRALGELQQLDSRARVALDADTGLATGIDGTFRMPMPPAARSLPGSDRAAAASVIFLDRFGGLFGIPGWHVLSPLSASPLGRSVWFAFEAQVGNDVITAHVCADEDTVKYVRIER